MNDLNVQGWDGSSANGKLMVDPESGRLKLPYKPFTLEEVCTITGCGTVWLDKLVGRQLQLTRPDPGVHGPMGLNDRATFAAFVGWKYFIEGAGWDRTRLVVLFVQSLTPHAIEMNRRNGDTFVQVDLARGVAAVMPAPDTKAGRELNLPRLVAEFNERLDKVFPKG